MGESYTNVFRYRGRELHDKDTVFIAEKIQAHNARDRSQTLPVLCDHWNWHQHNGKLKDYAARGLLLRLEEAKHIALPPPLRTKTI